MGLILGSGVRLGRVVDVMAAGEGLETVMSVRTPLPALPVVGAGSANHLDALVLPKTLRRLYVVEDPDPAGRRVTAAMIARAQAGGIEALPLRGAIGDLNDDLRQLGPEALHAALRVQLAPEDVARFWQPWERGGRAA